MSGFKENKKELLIQAVYAVMGSLLFALGVNLIIVPLGLYNGGFMGVAQLLRTFFVEVCRIPIPSGIDMSGIIYFIINIPLFYMGLRILGKELINYSSKRRSGRTGQIYSADPWPRYPFHCPRSLPG